MNHPRFNPLRLVALIPVFVFVSASSVRAQSSSMPSRTEGLALDTGLVASDGQEQETIATLYVLQEGAPWMRLRFAEVVLSGNVDAGTGSFLRITALEDGYRQILDSKGVEEWGDTSAYFNGDLVMIELVSYAGTGDNRVRLDEVVVGTLSSIAEPETICGQDDRELSSDPRAARLLPLECTGFLIDDDCGCFLTAGHCHAGVNVVQFNVPPSRPSGGLNHPPPSDQYSIDLSSKQFLDGRGKGNDWTYFGAFPNSTTGLTAADAQGSTFAFTAPPAWSPGLQVRITGYGADSGVRHKVQQTHVGPWVDDSPGAIVLYYRVDTMGGNSGSPVIQEETGAVMGIHTNGGCTTTGGANYGTSSVHESLQAALANPLGVCDPAPPSCANVPQTNVRNGSGMNPLCLTNQSPPAIGTSWEFDVDTSGVAGASFSVVRAAPPSTGTMLGIGELLVSLTPPDLFTTIRSGPGPHAHSIEVPALLELVGSSGSLQAVVGVGGQLRQLCNAIDFTVGCLQ